MWNLFTNSFRRQNLICFLVLCVAFVGCKDDDLQKQVDELNDRVTSLETMCAQMNTNISSMQTILNVVQQQDHITGITPVEENTVIIGYTITFAKNKPITIYNGKNGSSLFIHPLYSPSTANAWFMGPLPSPRSSMAASASEI